MNSPTRPSTGRRTAFLRLAVISAVEVVAGCALGRREINLDPRLSKGGKARGHETERRTVEVRRVRRRTRRRSPRPTDHGRFVGFLARLRLGPRAEKNRRCAKESTKVLTDKIAR